MPLIRPAARADIPAIAGLWNRIIRETSVTFTTEEKSPEALAEALARHPFLVIEADGAFAGFGCITPFRAGPGYAATDELSIFITNAACGRGLGPALLAALEETARAAGIHVLVAGISAENPGAIRFHARHGYAEVGRMPEVGRKFGRWLDLVLMQKIL